MAGAHLERVLLPCCGPIPPTWWVNWTDGGQKLCASRLLHYPSTCSSVCADVRSLQNCRKGKSCMPTIQEIFSNVLRRFNFDPSTIQRKGYMKVFSLLSIPRLCNSRGVLVSPCFLSIHAYSPIQISTKLHVYLYNDCLIISTDTTTLYSSKTFNVINVLYMYVSQMIILTSVARIV